MHTKLDANTPGRKTIFFLRFENLAQANTKYVYVNLDY